MRRYHIKKLIKSNYKFDVYDKFEADKDGSNEKWNHDKGIEDNIALRKYLTRYEITKSLKIVMTILSIEELKWQTLSTIDIQNQELSFNLS